jgi:hypothetical protein
VSLAGTTQAIAALKGAGKKVPRTLKSTKGTVKRGKKAGVTHVHHLWISDWRSRTGGTLQDGRAAWKALGPDEKVQAKSLYAAQHA